MYDELTGKTLENFRLLRRPSSVWLFLLRSGRLHNKQKRESSAESTNTDDQDGVEDGTQGDYFDCIRGTLFLLYLSLCMEMKTIVMLV